MADEFKDMAEGLSDPADSLAAVTPHDTNVLPNIPKALWIGTAGNISIVANDDSTPVLLKNVQGLLPVRAKIVRATGTTAADIVAML